MKRNSLRLSVTRPIDCALVLGLIALVGCDRSKATRSGPSPDQPPPVSAESSSPSVYADGLTGQAILQNVIARYTAAKSYRDRAVLYLNYRLEGRPIQEPHPFSVVWDSQNRISSRVFNSQLQCDGRLLSCYVFDNDTENLDNQQLFIPVAQKIPLRELYGNSIVRHYLGGYAELPLDEHEKLLPPKLIPPTASLLTKQLSFGWIENSKQVQRLNDQTLDGRLCYVVRSLYEDSTADIWIDQQSQLLSQISLPLRIMARPVLTSGEIEDVELLAKFHDAMIDEPVDPSIFAVQSRAGATPVRLFVAIPDPFPLESIGQPAPPFELQQTGGNIVDLDDFKGKTTALLWLGGTDSQNSLQQLMTATKAFSAPDFHIGAVYAESDLAAPDSSSLEPNKALQAAGLPLYFDRQLLTSTKLQIKTIPTVVVLGDQSRIEFARALSDDNWFEDLRAALDRVHRGENVALEMQLEYQKFLEDYHRQLTAVSAADLINAGAVAEPKALAHTNAPGHSSTSRDMLKAPDSSLQAVLQWSNREFQRAGNVLINSRNSPATILVFDGWRTLVELDLDGHLVARHELKLPDQAAVSCLRVAQSKRDPAVPARTAFAAFSVHGDQVYLFDDDWKLIAALPDPEFQHDGIRDVQIGVLVPDGPEQVIVSFVNDRGCFIFDSANRTTRQISTEQVDSLAAVAGKLLYCNAGNMGLLGGDAPSTAAPVGASFQRLLAAESKTQTSICLTATDRENNWSVIGMGSDLKIDWQLPIGSQLFESEIEPLAMCRNDAGVFVLGLADANGSVNLLSVRGDYLGQFSSQSAMTGIGLIEQNNELQLLVSTAEGLSSYRMSAGRIPALPVSNPRGK